MSDPSSVPNASLETHVEAHPTEPVPNRLKEIATTHTPVALRASVQARHTSLSLYLCGTGSWFFFHGVQHVLFAWLVTLVLRESPLMVGATQIAMLLPATLLTLVGGGIADRFGGQRVAVVAQCLAVIPPVFLGAALALNSLSLKVMFAYAIAIGTLQAFIIPARDGLLNMVASGEIQRTVTKATLVQFFAQILGFSLAGTADHLGGVVVIGLQASVLAAGAWTLSQVRVAQPERILRKTERTGILQSIAVGFRTVWQNPHMRMVVFQNIAMGICFMGSYIVTIPLLIRERYLGSAADLATVNFLNCIGLVAMLVLLLLIGNIRRQGRALILANGIGALVLATAGIGVSFAWFLVIIFFWGVCGGIALSMSRTIMQEQAPEGQRARVMACFAFSFMGAGPIGAFACGLLVEFFGPELSLAIACLVLFAAVIVISLCSQLWRMRSPYLH